MNVIIPLGGKGERFKKKGFDTPKPLIKILDKTMINYILDNLYIDDKVKVFIIYNVNLDKHNFSNVIKEKYHNISLIPINIQTKGASETLSIGLKNIINITPYKKCLLLDCDTFYTTDIIKYVHNSENNTIFYFNDYEQDNPIYSYIDLNNNKEILKIREKEKISNNANTGAYFFTNIDELYKYSLYVVENNINFKSEYYTSCIIDVMLRDSIKFYGHKLQKESVFFLGTPEQVNEYIDRTYAFLFDLDGTLVDTDDIYIKVWEELLDKYNLFIDNSLYSTFILGNNDYKVITSLLRNANIDINELSKQKDKLFLKYISNIIIKQGVIELINIIRNSGHKVCIVTNCNRNTATEILKYFSISFDHLIIGSECKNAKPYPDPYIEALKLLNISNNKAIIFEDSKTGLLSALGTYPKCIVGIENNNNSEVLLSLGSNIVINNYINLDINRLLEYKDNKLEKVKNNIIESLNNRYNIHDIIINNNKLKGGYISDVIELEIKLLDGSSIDSVLKLENKQSNNLSDMANLLDLYKREYYFYENIYSYININVPKFYGIVKDEDFNSIGIMLENLNTNEYILNLNLNKESISVSLRIIDSCTKLHSMFWNKPLLDNFRELTKNNTQQFKWSPFINKKWSIFKNKWNNMLSIEQLKIAETIVNNFDKIESYLSTGILTLCHGDFKSANMFFRINSKNEYDPYFIDWQYIIVGKGVQDLVFFMIESYDIDTINKYSKLFIEYYYIKLLENGVKNYSKEDYIMDIQMSICYFPFFVAIWFGTVDSDELIDKNFPFFFIQKLFNFIDFNLNIDLLNNL